MPGNPFLDQNGSYYNPPTHQEKNPQYDPNKPFGGGRRGFEIQPYVDVPNQPGGLNRSQAVGDYSNYLMGRQGPQFQAASNADLMAARQNQMQSLGLMQNMASGNGPSVAGQQTYGALGNNIAAMNAGSQGGNAAGAMMSGYGSGVNAAMSGAGARSNEQAGLMSEYGQGAAQLGAGDISQYGIDAQQMARARALASQQGILNAQTTFGIQGQEQQAEIGNESYQQALANQAHQQAVQNGSNIMTGINVGASTMGGFAKSDERYKRGIRRGGLMY